MENIHSINEVKELANKANMSRRTFDRKFREMFQMSPKEWLIDKKISIAKELLEDGYVSIELIAEKSGFEDSGKLRHHFNNKLKISPKQYQKQFFNA